MVFNAKKWLAPEGHKPVILKKRFAAQSISPDRKHHQGAAFYGLNAAFPG